MARAQARRGQAAHSPLSLGPVARQGSWRKVHLAADEATLEVRAVEITGSGVGDAPMLPGLEAEWLDWIVEPPRNANAAFIGFFRNWFEKRGRPG